MAPKRERSASPQPDQQNHKKKTPCHGSHRTEQVQDLDPNFPTPPDDVHIYWLRRNRGKPSSRPISQVGSQSHQMFTQVPATKQGSVLPQEMNSQDSAQHLLEQWPNSSQQAQGSTSMPQSARTPTAQRSTLPQQGTPQVASRTQCNRFPQHTSLEDHGYVFPRYGNSTLPQGVSTQGVQSNQLGSGMPNTLVEQVTSAQMGFPTLQNAQSNLVENPPNAQRNTDQNAQNNPTNTLPNAQNVHINAPTISQIGPSNISQNALKKPLKSALTSLLTPQFVGTPLGILQNGPRFKDLGGMEGVFEELIMRVIIPVLNPELGMTPTSGILLYGPPGCGKTKLAHAIATETGFSFYRVSAPEFFNSYVGNGEKGIRELFSRARTTAPSIIFVDEIDAVASKREELHHHAYKSIVTQLLTCMDESCQTDNQMSDQKSRYVLVIGATNKPDALDEAVRRPGRFDYEIHLGVPDENARLDILYKLTRNTIVEGTLDLRKIAKSTPGFVGADLKALIDAADNIAKRRVIKRKQYELLEQQVDQGSSEEWWKIQRFTSEEIKRSRTTMADFEEAINLVQPSSRREGFSTTPETKWKDVGGLDSLREEFKFDIIDRIKYPEDYVKFGVKSGVGFLLYGPPGCGKTLIAKAVANESGANFIHIQGPELFKKEVGESEKAIRTIFSRARTCSPCVIFFDEVDSITTKREYANEIGRRILNQLLTELDGGNKRQGVFVIGATNRPEVMDDAVKRPGRFGKHLYVPLPGPNDRGLILKSLARNKCIDPSVDLMAIGRKKDCENLSGADLEAVLDEATKVALQERRMMLSRESPNWDTWTIKETHIEQALQKVCLS